MLSSILVGKGVTLLEYILHTSFTVEERTILGKDDALEQFVYKNEVLPSTFLAPSMLRSPAEFILNVIDLGKNELNWCSTRHIGDLLNLFIFKDLVITDTSKKAMNHPIYKLNKLMDNQLTHGKAIPPGDVLYGSEVNSDKTPSTNKIFTEYFFEDADKGGVRPPGCNYHFKDL
jgi:hypothetical protein